MKSGLSPLAGLAVAVGVTVLVYWPGLNGPLILDDVANLDVLRRLDAQGALSLANVLAEKGALLDSRPVSFLSFLLNWRLTGDDVWSLKLTNLALHVVNGVLVYLLAGTLLRFSTHLPRDAIGWCAAMAAAFWLLTPVQVSSVLYVIQRMAGLACAFTLLGMLAWCQGRLQQARRPRLALALMGLALAACWPLAALSKQNGVLLAPLLLVTEWLIISPRSGPRSTVPARVLVFVVATPLVLAALRAGLDPGWILDGYAVRDFTLTERLLSQPRALFHQALNVLQLPGGTALGLFHDGFRVSHALFDPPFTAVALAGWAAVPLLAWRLRGTLAGLGLYGLVFFLAASALEAGPFALEIYFEHRSYLPSVGLALAVAVLAGAASRRLPRSGLIAGAAVVLLAGYTAVTAARVVDWTSWASIVEANARRHPDSVRAQTGVAVLAFRSRRLEAGLEALARVGRIGGERVRGGLALHALTGHCLAWVSPPPAALGTVAALSGVGDDPYTVGALRWYREVVTTTDCPGQDRHAVALTMSRLILSRPGPGPRRGNWILHDEAARLLAAAGEPSIARLHLSRALRFAPASVRPALVERRKRLHRH